MFVCCIVTHLAFGLSSYIEDEVDQSHWGRLSIGHRYCRNDDDVENDEDGIENDEGLVEKDHDAIDDNDFMQQDEDVIEMDGGIEGDDITEEQSDFPHQRRNVHCWWTCRRLPCGKKIFRCHCRLIPTPAPVEKVTCKKTCPKTRCVKTKCKIVRQVPSLKSCM